MAETSLLAGLPALDRQHVTTLALLCAAFLPPLVQHWTIEEDTTATTTSSKQVKSSDMPTQTDLNASRAENAQEATGETFPLLLQLFKDPTAIGAVSASSSLVADVLTKHIEACREEKSSLRILEVGAGTGAITKTLLTRATPEDVIHVSELSDEMCEASLVPLVEQYSFLNVTVTSGDFLSKFDSTDEYDIIVSTLPFTCFEPELVKAFLKRFQELLKPDGVISFLEYAYLRKMRVFLGDARCRLVEESVASFLQTRPHEKDFVMLNAPPAWVFHVYGHKHGRAEQLVKGEDGL